MKPKQKANILKNIFGKLAPLVVDEVLKSEPTAPVKSNRGMEQDTFDDMCEALEYWNDVKKELLK